MTDEPRDFDSLFQRARAGDRVAFGEVFALHAERLRQVVRLRLDQRLRRRLNPSDVLQEAYLDAAERFDDYAQQPDMPFFLWLRFLTLQRLLMLHRHHLGTQARDVSREVPCCGGAYPDASSAELAAKLVGRLSTPSRQAMRAEVQARLQEALSLMDATDREILALRHFEQLNNGEAAKVLGLRESTASMRYARALLRLKEILSAWDESREGM